MNVKRIVGRWHHECDNCECDLSDKPAVAVGIQEYRILWCFQCAKKLCKEIARLVESEE